MKIRSVFYSLSLGLCLLVAGCNSSSKSAGISALPEVASFMQSHAELGVTEHVEAVDPWAQGQRQRVVTQDNRMLLFYLKDGEVESVYDQTNQGRVTVYQRK